ncbi:hypothetical protein GALMADRAFT_216561 [Galerina marginata CBS 339.88]|uniref:Uncharacterized protein n=1 Tax=Galerina marginata (strain CBS 339.88) TaxID=685588 RepID=A0A067SHQ4_GALM3|nr:hypothetical protein GALMADRAFT_216561 [Galerina marginata CBS 339.88]
MTPSKEYPYREASGKACFVCESNPDFADMGSSNCPRCSPSSNDDPDNSELELDGSESSNSESEFGGDDTNNMDVEGGNERNDPPDNSVQDSPTLSHEASFENSAEGNEAEPNVPSHGQNDLIGDGSPTHQNNQEEAAPTPNQEDTTPTSTAVVEPIEELGRTKRKRVA